MKILIIQYREIEKDLLRAIEKEISKRYKANILISAPQKLPEARYRAGQFNVEDFLPGIEKLTEENKADIGLGITNIDLYVENLNFIFGLAYGNNCIISLARLNPEFYREPENKELFTKRAVKEAIHELGHVYGLNHCPDLRCVMHFSNSLPETDYKEKNFCENCLVRLEKSI